MSANLGLGSLIREGRPDEEWKVCQQGMVKRHRDLQWIQDWVVGIDCGLSLRQRIIIRGVIFTLGLGAPIVLERELVSVEEQKWIETHLFFSVGRVELRSLPLESAREHGAQEDVTLVTQ